MAERHKSFGYTDPDEIRSRMLAEWPGHMPATCRFACFDKTYLGTTRYSDDLSIKDDSFSRQMWQLYADPTSVHPRLTTRPDAYVLTADSAIPVATSIRSFYRTLGKPLPLITYINADRGIARNYFERNIVDDAEIDRLGSELSEAQHVTVVDQYVYSGSSFACAAALLHHAGVDNISGIRGRWYEHFNAEHVDREHLRSREDQLMKSIGEMAALRSYQEEVA